MKTIYKYEIEFSINKIELPKGYEILTVQTQNENIFIWIKLDPNENQKESVTIEVFGTGEMMVNENTKYIGTVQKNGGLLIWHIFQRL